MNLTLRQYYHFQGNSFVEGRAVDSAPAWDLLRMNDKDASVFAISKERSLWLQEAISDKGITSLARDVIRIIAGRFWRIYSYGVGRGFLEYLIKIQSSELFVSCSDYTPNAIQRLRENFVEADEVILFDLLKDPWTSHGDGVLHLFYGVDTPFDDDQWRCIFKKTSEAGIQYILFIPRGMEREIELIMRSIKYFILKRMGKKLSFVGYLRTYGRIKSLFDSYYEIESAETLGDKKSFLLKLRNL